MSMAVAQWRFSIDLSYRYQVLLDQNNLNWVRRRLMCWADKHGVRMDSFCAVLVGYELSEQEMQGLMESSITSRTYQALARKLFMHNQQYSICLWEDLEESEEVSQ